MQVSEHHRIANLRSQCGEQLRPALASSSPPHALGSVPRGTVPCGPLCWPLSSNVSCRDHGSAFSQQQSAEVSKVSLGQAPPVQACSVEKMVSESFGFGSLQSSPRKPRPWT